MAQHAQISFAMYRGTSLEEAFACAYLYLEGHMMQKHFLHWANPERVAKLMKAPGGRRN
jgi:hypothetical protein